MTKEEFEAAFAKVLEVFPFAQLDEDQNGYLVIDLGLYMNEDGSVEAEES